MDQSAGATTGARRDQDIALDLLKFVATTTSIIRPTRPGRPGGQGPDPT